MLRPQVIKLARHNDSRGSFGRIFSRDVFKDFLKEGEHICQVNHSHTRHPGVVRGMHFQYMPHAETKIVQCISGRIMDVCVDIRKGSPEFLKPFYFELDSDLPSSLLIPKGYAHGFQSIQGETSLVYLHTSFYNPKAEGGLNPCDPLLNIEWPLAISDMSEKDQSRCIISELSSEFSGIEV